MTISEKHFGEHFLIDFHGCDPEVIGDAKLTEEALLSAATECGSTIIDHRFHQFAPKGASGIILIQESHFSVHTWPEDAFVAVDIFTSGTKMQPELAIRMLQRAFVCERVEVIKVLRGALDT